MPVLGVPAFVVAAVAAAGGYVLFFKGGKRGRRGGLFR